MLAKVRTDGLASPRSILEINARSISAFEAKFTWLMFEEIRRFFRLLPTAELTEFVWGSAAFSGVVIMLRMMPFAFSSDESLYTSITCGV